MKTALLLLSASLLVTACKHSDSSPGVSDNSPRQVSETKLGQRIIGSWWFDHYNRNGPFTLVTFSPDGRMSALSTNSPKDQARDGYWRVTAEGMLLITKTKDALPGSNDEMFILDHMSDTEMVFGHPSVAGRMTFRK